MKTLLRSLFFLSLWLTSPALCAWHWLDLWKTPDQQGTRLLQAGDAKQAAKKFENKAWQGVAHYRAGNYQTALENFREQKDSDGYYNAGNASAFLEHYQDALKAYDKAIALNPNNTDAITNRQIIKKIMQDKQKNKSSSKNSSSSKDDKKPDESKTADNQTNQKDNQDNSKNSNKDTQADNQKSAQSKPKNGQIDKKIENTQDQTQEKMSEAPASSQGQDEKQQIFRRIVDNPGGLLRQKFLRDYLRRHRDNNSFGQGGN